MKRVIEEMEPDSDWDEDHLPQAVEFHTVTKYHHLFEMFQIPFHYKVRGNDCTKKAVEEYLNLFEQDITQTEMNFKQFKNTYGKQVWDKDVGDQVPDGHLPKTNQIYHTLMKQMFEEYQKTKVLPKLKKKCPSKRSPLYKKINREKLFDHEHFIEKYNGI